MRTRNTLLLTVIQIVIAVSLLALGDRQVPTGMRDSPPFILPPATKLCVAINAPAVVLALAALRVFGGTRIVIGRSHLDITEACLIAWIGLFWYLIGLEFELQVLKRSAIGWRLLSGGLLVGFAAVMVLFGVAALREGEILLSMGGLAWSFVLLMFCGVRLIRWPLSIL